MRVTDILDPKPSIAEYQRQVQPLINEGHRVYLRVANLEDLHITYDYPRIKLADGSVVADMQQGKQPSGGEDIRFEYPARELREKGEHRIAFEDHYNKAGRHLVDEWLTLYADKVMVFPVVKAIFLLANYGRILEELDPVSARKLLLEQQVAEDAAAEALEAEPPAEVEVVEEPPAKPKKTNTRKPKKPAFLKEK
jgi:hypothetical protein